MSIPNIFLYAISVFIYVCTVKRNDRRGDIARWVEVEGDADIN